MQLKGYIFNLAQSYRMNLKQAVNAHDLGLNGMHVRCLHAIANQKQCTANTIVVKMGKDKAQIARLIKDMIDKGWLKKQASAEDKRSQIITLSNDGMQLQQKIKQLEIQLQTQLLAGLSEQEIAEYYRISAKILANTPMNK